MRIKLFGFILIGGIFIIILSGCRRNQSAQPLSKVNLRLSVIRPDISRIASKLLILTALAIPKDDQIRDVAVAIYPIRNSRKKPVGLFILLDDITAMSQSQRAIVWAALAQRLTHQIKTPLSSVTLATQPLQMEYQRDEAEKAPVYDRHVDYVINEAQRLKLITDGFMKLAQLKNRNLRRRIFIASSTKCWKKRRTICRHKSRWLRNLLRMCR